MNFASIMTLVFKLVGDPVLARLISAVRNSQLPSFDDIMSLINMVRGVLGGTGQGPAAPQAFDAKWLQTALNEVAKPNPPLVVDGSPGQMTQAVVKQYQQSKIDAHVEGWTAADADGWAGTKTSAALYNDQQALHA